MNDIIAKTNKRPIWKRLLVVSAICFLALYVWGQVMIGNTFITKIIQIPGAYNERDWSLDELTGDNDTYLLLEVKHDPATYAYTSTIHETDLFGSTNRIVFTREVPLMQYREKDSIERFREISPDMKFAIIDHHRLDSFFGLYDIEKERELAVISEIAHRGDQLNPTPRCHWSPSVRYLGCRSTLKEADQWVPVITFFDTETLTYTAPFRIDSTGSPYMYDFSWIDDTTIVMTGSDDESHKRNTGNDENENSSNILYRISNLFDTPSIQRLDNLATCIETVYMNEALYCLRTYDSVKRDQPGSVATWGMNISPNSHVLIRQTLDQKDAVSYTVMNPFPFWFGDTMQMNDTYLAVYASSVFRIFDIHTGKQKMFNDYQYLYSGDQNLTSKDTTIFGPQNFYQYTAIYRKVDTH